MPLATCVEHGTSGTCDIGLKCCPHGRSGTNAEGTELFESEGKLVHLLTHHGPTHCPHGGTFASVQGAELIEVEGLPVTLIGHTTQCVACGQTGAHVEGTDLLEVDF
ncbi:MAG: hypothetical protein LBQ90_05065 [Synergistaceae bacterium]|jgi:uncharacterized Zn-binding protein involved in type VI secretion|nr:hypothetical protein [Synergistaceae bacterium]